MTAENPLPVLETVKKSFADAFRDPKAQWHVMGLMAIILMGVNIVPVVIGLVTHGFNDTTATNPNRVMLFLVAVVQVVVGAVFSQSWYRQALLGEDKGARILFRVGPGEITMMLTVLKALAFTALPAMVASWVVSKLFGPSFLGLPLMLAIAIGTIYGGMRLFIAQPLSALGEPAPIKTAWESSKSHALSIMGGMFLLVLGFYIPVGIVTVILTIILAYILPAFLMAILVALAQGLIGAALFLLMINYAANVYRFLKNAN